MLKAYYSSIPWNFYLMFPQSIPIGMALLSGQGDCAWLLGHEGAHRATKREHFTWMVVAMRRLARSNLEWLKRCSPMAFRFAATLMSAGYNCSKLCHRGRFQCLPLPVLAGYREEDFCTRGKERKEKPTLAKRPRGLRKGD
eukprot:1016795-Pelagomonas_calceolata.AAC.3